MKKMKEKTATATAPKWWKTAVIYQIYPRSLQDSNADGIGDLNGIRQRMAYLKDLGIGAIWISPFFKSPQADFGYDISDYCAVDPQFGTMDDFDQLLTEAHGAGLRVILDLVPNHTSDQHQWFKEACKGRDNPYRDWYIWRDPAADGGPPNNWQSFFGGSAWTYHAPTGQYYLRHFLSSQPDLNFRNPAVVKAILDVMRFWFDKGVDGFRIDVIWMCVDHKDFLDEPLNPHWREGMPDRDRTLHIYTDNQPESHELSRQMRQVADSYSGDRVLIGEIYHSADLSYAGTKKEPEMHIPFNFRLIQINDKPTALTPGNIRKVVEDYEAARYQVGCPPNWAIGNHDRERVATRLGANARLGTMLLLTLGGTPTWYYGDEIGMPDGHVPPERIQDPADVPGSAVFHRDYVRTPMQWDKSAFGGFSTVEPWLPTQDFATRNVADQLADPSSHLNLFRSLARMRQSEPALLEGEYKTVSSGSPKVYSYQRSSGDQRIYVYLNFGKEECPITLGKETVPMVSTYMDEFHTRGRQYRLRPHEGLVLRSI